jgi:hypothetical protein
MHGRGSSTWFASSSGNATAYPPTRHCCHLSSRFSCSIKKLKSRSWSKLRLILFFFYNFLWWCTLYILYYILWESICCFRFSFLNLHLKPKKYNNGQLSTTYMIKSHGKILVRSSAQFNMIKAKKMLIYAQILQQKAIPKKPYYFCKLKTLYL